MSGAPLRWAAAAIAIVALFVVPPLWGHFLPQQLSDYLIFGLPALAVGLIAGHARLLNIGVGATFGVSAYAVAIMTHHGVLNPVVLVLVALAAGVLVSVLFAVYAIVATGLEYLLLTLLTTAAFFALPLLFAGETGGENGLAAKGVVVISFGLDPLIGNGFYWLICAVTVFWCFLSWYLLSSRAGRVMVAIGRNPTRAAAMGYSVHGYQVAVTLYSGAIAASGGWLYALNHAFVFEDLLGLGTSVNVVVYSLVGGVNTIVGPLLGAAGIRWLSDSLGRMPSQDLPRVVAQLLGQPQLIIGLVLLVVVYFMPDGVVGLVGQLTRLRQLVRSRGDVEAEPIGGTLARELGSGADD